MSDGGSALTEDTEVAVSATGPPPRVSGDDRHASGVPAKGSFELVRRQRVEARSRASRSSGSCSVGHAWGILNVNAFAMIGQSGG